MTAAAYVNPFKDATVTAERIDQGVDYALRPGDPIEAIGAGKVIGVSPNWYAGQPYLEYQLTGGPLKGDYIFAAEQIRPTVKAGDTLNAGDVIGRYAPTGTRLEMGFGSPVLGESYAKQAGGGYVEGQLTAAGQAFSDFLSALGAPAGLAQGRKVTGTYGGLTIDPNSPVLQQDLAAGRIAAQGGTDAASGGVAGKLASGPTEAIAALFSGFFDWIKGGLLKALLFLVLVGGGIALAGYGLVQAVSPPGGGRPKPVPVPA